MVIHKYSAFFSPHIDFNFTDTTIAYISRYVSINPTRNPRVDVFRLHLKPLQSIIIIKTLFFFNSMVLSN